MEVIFYIIFVIIFYCLSYTIFLPWTLLLKINKTTQDMCFSFFFAKILAPILGPKFVKHRKYVFELLEKRLQKRNKAAPLEVLEIGIGTGANLRYYPENVNLTALDMNESFIKCFQANAKNFPEINYVKTILSFAEDMSEIADHTFDVVIGTHVLCSVKDVESVLKEVKRVLKPGGKYVFMEHSVYPANDFKRRIQKSMAPLWKIYCDGCCLDRNLADYINKAGFSDVYLEKKFPSELLLFFRPHVVGIAAK